MAPCRLYRRAGVTMTFRSWIICARTVGCLTNPLVIARMLKSDFGQFFAPREPIAFAVEMLNPDCKQLVLEPPRSVPRGYSAQLARELSHQIDPKQTCQPHPSGERRDALRHHARVPEMKCRLANALELRRSSWLPTHPL
jgi:hypothetical protein